MPYRIPSEDISAVVTMKSMSRSSIDAMIAALKSVPLTSDTDEMAALIAKSVPSIPSKELEAVLDTLYGLYTVREMSGVPRDVFLDDFIEGMQEEPAFAVDKKDVPKLRAAFQKLLDIEMFNILSKARRLQRDGERLYCDAKILSDIRPVFREKASSRPAGAVITHTLKLGYHERGDHKEFHVVLDSIDLGLLFEVLDRAYGKDKTLRKFLSESNLPRLGV